MENCILDYEDFYIIKRGDRYYATDKATGKEREVLLVHRETDITLNDEQLFNSCDNYDYSGEETTSTDYLFFRLVPSRLTNEEYNVLGTLSSKSKMDCWFDIREINEHEDCVYDLEYGTTMPLKDGLIMFNEGLLDLSEYGLDENQKNIYNNMLGKFGIGELK